MKKAICIFLSFVCILSITGCNKADELGKNSVISVIFANYKNDSYVFTTEASDFSTLQKKDDSPEISYFSATGSSPATAWENLKNTFPYTPYFGHVNAIVLEEGFYKKNAADVMNFFISENAISPNAAVYITKCSPYDFENLSISRQATKKILPVSEMYTFFSPASYYLDIPVLKCKNEAPECDSTALFTDFSHSGEIDGKNLFLYSLLKNKDYEKSFGTFEITSSKAKIKTKNEKLKINLELFLKSIVPTSPDNAKKFFSDEIKAFIAYLEKENLTHILTNEKFSDYDCKIRISMQETSKLKGNKK